MIHGLLSFTLEKVGRQGARGWGTSDLAGEGVNETAGGQQARGVAKGSRGEGQGG